MRILFILFLFAITPAHARVFNIGEASFAAYFSGNVGTSNVKKDTYDKSSGSQTVFSDESSFNWGGELGISFPTQFYTIRLGLQAISPYSPDGIKGKNAAGTELMSVDSSAYGFFPVAHLEYYVMSDSIGRVYISVGGGYGKISMKNTYSLTVDGDAAYSTPNNFSVSASQKTYLLDLGVGYEMSFVQATTISFDFGYRYSVARKLKYDSDGEDFSGTHAEGDQVLNSDGKSKILDLGGVFAGLSFRFYFQ